MTCLKQLLFLSNAKRFLKLVITRLDIEFDKGLDAEFDEEIN